MSRQITAAARREIARLDDIADRALGSARPLPESVKHLARERPCFVQTQPRALIWPLRAADGRTWAQVKADKENAVDRG